MSTPYRFPDNTAVSRRTALKAIAFASAGTMLPRSFAQTLAAGDWRRTVRAYLETLAKPDGGYGWADQDESHLTPTHAVIGAYRLLGGLPPKAKTLPEFLRTHHPLRLKRRERDLRGFELQQIQSLRWLSDDAADFHPLVRGWKAPTQYPANYEKQRFPIFAFELTAFICRDLLGLPLDDLSPEFLRYLAERRRANGSFNNTPAADGSDGNVLNTWWGLQALRTLGRPDERRTETIAWLQACQLPNGGFTHQPKATMGAVDNVAYTWAAVRALKELGAKPPRHAACLDYLRSLWNGDGGFGDRPGWSSNPVATFYALDALEGLGALQEQNFRGSSVKTKVKPAALPDNLRVFTIQIEAHGKGSPAEAVDLAGALRIHLWGAKNADPRWITQAQKLADARGVPVKFFVANEEYGTFVQVPGQGNYSHTSDIIAPAGANIGPSLANAGDVTWDEFRARRLAPLERGNGRLIWQFGENEALTRLYLDDSLKRGGYAAISTFHFGNPDFTLSQPFLQHYRGQLPFIALQDAHGGEPWWFGDMTTGFRTLFLATEPTWDGWLKALRENWVVAVRHDAVSSQRTWMHGGKDEVIDFVRRHDLDWRWWDNPGIQRPLVSIVAVRPEDEFEAARPERGVTLRVRTQWENTTQGLPKKQLVELLSLSVDGKQVEPEPVRKGKPGAWSDVYHQHHVPAMKSGRHIATAVVRLIESGREARRTIEFVA